MNDYLDPDSGADEPGPQHADELLSAYLADELDEVRARRLERRLASDAALRADLDSVHDAVLALRRIDEVVPPEGLDARIRATVAAAPSRPSAPAVGEQATPDTAAPRGGARRGPRGARAPVTAQPWWRRPVAAVAALALLGVVAVSSLGVGLLGGSGDAGSTAEDAAVTAQGAQPEAAQAPQAEEQEAAADAARSVQGGEGEEGDEEGAGAGIPEAAASAAAGTALAAPAGVVDVPGLDSSAARIAYLAEVRSRPEAQAALRAGGSQAPDGRVAEQRALLQDRGLAPECAARLVGEASPAVELLATEIDGTTAVGAVLIENDALRLELVATDTCAVVAAERLEA